MTSPQSQRRSGEIENTGEPPKVNEEELKTLIRGTMQLARGLPPRDHGTIINKIDRNEPDMAPEPPKRPKSPSKGDSDKKKKLPAGAQKKKQSIKKQSIRPHH